MGSLEWISWYKKNRDVHYNEMLLGGVYKPVISRFPLRKLKACRSCKHAELKHLSKHGKEIKRESVSCCERKRIRPVIHYSYTDSTPPSLPRTASSTRPPSPPSCSSASRSTVSPATSATPSTSPTSAMAHRGRRPQGVL